MGQGEGNLGQPGGWSCRHQEGVGSKHRLCSSRHMVPEELLPSLPLTPTPRHVPGRIYCFSSLVNARSESDGCAGSSSQDALPSSSSACPWEQQCNATAGQTGMRHREQSLARGL